jgi:hypothetical protein
MKALEKDRNRRYESASAFAADVQRYLHDEAVQACPPSVSFRLRKFVRRNRGRLAAAAGVFLSVTVLAATIGWAVHDRAARKEESERIEITRLAQVEVRVRDSLGMARTLMVEMKLAAARQKLAEARVQLDQAQLALTDPFMEIASASDLAGKAVGHQPVAVGVVGYHRQSSTKQCCRHGGLPPRSPFGSSPGALCGVEAEGLDDHPGACPSVKGPGRADPPHRLRGAALAGGRYRSPEGRVSVGAEADFGGGRPASPRVPGRSGEGPPAHAGALLPACRLPQGPRGRGGVQGRSGTGHEHEAINSLNSSVTVRDSTVTTNPATEGGGIDNNGSLATLDVRGSTFSGNTASDSGGGIYNLATDSVQQSALSGNTAGSDSGGIFNAALGTLAIKHSTVLNNVTPEPVEGLQRLQAALQVACPDCDDLGRFPAVFVPCSAGYRTIVTAFSQRKRQRHATPPARACGTGSRPPRACRRRGHG